MYHLFKVKKDTVLNTVVILVMLQLATIIVSMAAVSMYALTISIGAVS